MGKKYYHRTPGAKFYAQVGTEAKEIAFAGGVVDIDSIPEQYRASVQAELDKVADYPASHIYTKEAVIEPGEVTAAREVMQTAEQQFDTDKGIQGNPTTIPIPVSKPGLPELPPGIVAARAAVQAAGVAKVPPAVKPA